VQDQVFLDGRDLRGDRRFLPNALGAPVSAVDPSLVRTLLGTPEDHARSYLCLTVSGWRGQLVLSTFVRFLVTPKHLFVEVSRSLLTPLREDFGVRRAVDQRGPCALPGGAVRRVDHGRASGFPGAGRVGPSRDFSSALVQGQLRNRLGYGGLVLTDSL